MFVITINKKFRDDFDFIRTKIKQLLQRSHEINMMN